MDFPPPDPKDARTFGKPMDESFYDLRDTNLFNAKVILSRKKTRNFLNVSNLWKRTVISGIEGQTLADHQLQLYKRNIVEKRPLVHDVNTEVVGRASIRRRVEPLSSEDDDHIPIHRRYPSPTPGTTSWAQAPMGTWGRGRL
jgi:hypothetical protein